MRTIIFITLSTLLVSSIHARPSLKVSSTHQIKLNIGADIQLIDLSQPGKRLLKYKLDNYKGTEPAWLSPSSDVVEQIRIYQAGEQWFLNIVLKKYSGLQAKTSKVDGLLQVDISTIETNQPKLVQADIPEKPKIFTAIVPLENKSTNLFEESGAKKEINEKPNLLEAGRDEEKEEAVEEISELPEQPSVSEILFSSEEKAIVFKGAKINSYSFKTGGDDEHVLALGGVKLSGQHLNNLFYPPDTLHGVEVVRPTENTTGVEISIFLEEGYTPKAFRKGEDIYVTVK